MCDIYTHNSSSSLCTQVVMHSPPQIRQHSSLGSNCYHLGQQRGMDNEATQLKKDCYKLLKNCEAGLGKNVTVSIIERY